jgi:Muconolactone delta-isomerase
MQPQSCTLGPKRNPRVALQSPIPSGNPSSTGWRPIRTSTHRREAAVLRWPPEAASSRCGLGEADGVRRRYGDDRSARNVGGCGRRHPYTGGRSFCGATSKGLLRLWLPPWEPGEWRTWGPFSADDADQLEQILVSMPLRVWRHDTVTPFRRTRVTPAGRARRRLSRIAARSWAARDSNPEPTD